MRGQKLTQGWLSTTIEIVLAAARLRLFLISSRVNLGNSIFFVVFIFSAKFLDFSRRKSMTFFSKILSNASLRSMQKVSPRILPKRLAFSRSEVYFLSSSSRVGILPGPLDLNLLICCQNGLEVG